MTFKILTDSTTDLSEKWAAEHDVTIPRLDHSAGWSDL